MRDVRIYAHFIHNNESSIRSNSNFSDLDRIPSVHVCVEQFVSG
jgi:hypothetical protein